MCDIKNENIFKKACNGGNYDGFGSPARDHALEKVGNINLVYALDVFYMDCSRDFSKSTVLCSSSRTLGKKK